MSGGRHADSGLQFLLGTDPRFMSILGMLAREGLVTPWCGRFGLLGVHGGGFLPAEVLASTPVASMMREQAMPSNEQQSTESGYGVVDFCGLLTRKSDSQKAYVGTPSNASIVTGLCAAAGIEVRLGSTVVAVHPTIASGAPGAAGGGGGIDGHAGCRWRIQLAAEDAQPPHSSDAAADPNVCEPFDALVLATHDSSLAASAVRAVLSAEASREHATAAEQVGEEAKNAQAVRSRLSQLADALQLQREQRTAPSFAWSGYFPTGFSERVPFDAVAVPGSSIVSFLARDASKPGRPALARMPRSIASDSGDLGGDLGGDLRGELWTAISTRDFASAVLANSTSSVAAAAVTESGDSERGGSAAGAANEAMSAEVRKLLGPFCAASAGELAPPPLASAAKRWGAGFAAGTLGLEEESVGLEPWRLAICGDYICKERASPAEAAALSGMDAAERVASWFSEDQLP